jgi:mono/diheme cytochrome c family protein
MLTMRRFALLSLLIGMAAAGLNAQSKAARAQEQLPPTYMMSGRDMYKQYCAACHGTEAKGDGPAAYALKIPPANLSTLAKRHMGKFPTDYVTAVLQFGPGVTAHGSTDMPTWGPLFQILDKQNDRAVRQRIKNLCDYLVTLQEK